MERGATLEQLRRAARGGSFADVAADLARGAAWPRVTLAELSASTGVPIERIQAIRIAAGLPAVGPEDAVLTEDDSSLVSEIAMGEALFGEVALRRFNHVAGTALARIAEAAVSLSMFHLETPMRAAGAGELALLQARYRAIQSGRPLVSAMGKLFRAHLEAAGRRVRAAVTPGGETAGLTVGFVDLVGFTTLTRRLDTQSLVQVIERFQDTAHEVAAECGGQIVKFVGDEVMFVTPEAGAACDIALTMIDRFAGDPAVTPSAGVARGDVLVRGGDYYGPIVNLAARLVEHAVPSEVLVAESVAADPMPGGIRFEPAGRRVLKGFDEPVRVLTAARAST